LTRNFSWWRRTSEYLQDQIFRDAWPAALTTQFIQPSFRIWREQVTLPKSLGSASQLRLGFASDFHSGPLTPAASIETACAALVAAAPDLILLGGDFVSLAARHVQRLRDPFRSLAAPLGIFAVLGNHDHWAGATTVSSMLQDLGITLLTNTSRVLPAPYQNTILAGLDDHISGYPDPAGPRWDAAAATILLIHQPSGLLDAADHPFDVALAGHTHGGQIQLPGGLALVVPQGPLSRRHLAGRYLLPGGRALFVSVGIGNSGLPLRLGPTPEILLLDVFGTRTAT
jgi:predicted MPP superfamily phosphohydrolase